MKDSIKKYMEGSPPYLQPEGFLKKRSRHKMSNLTHSERLLRLEMVDKKKLKKVFDSVAAELAVSEAKNTQLEKEFEDSKADKG